MNIKVGMMFDEMEKGEIKSEAKRVNLIKKRCLICLIERTVDSWTDVNFIKPFKISLANWEQKGFPLTT